MKVCNFFFLFKGKLFFLQVSASCQGVNCILYLRSFAFFPLNKMLYSAATDFLVLTLLFVISALYLLGINTPEEFENM